MSDKKGVIIIDESFESSETECELRRICLNVLNQTMKKRLKVADDEKHPIIVITSRVYEDEIK